MNKIIIDCDRHVMEPLEIWEQYCSPEIFNSMPVHFNLDDQKSQEERYKRTGIDIRLSPTFKLGEHPILSNWSEEQQIASALIRDESHETRASAMSSRNQVESMHKSGISKALMFPTFAMYIVNHDKITSEQSVNYAKAYNSWIQSYCESHQELLPVGMISRHDSELLVSQIQDIVKKGWNIITTRPEPILGKNLGHPDNDPFWAECEKHNIVICFHGGTHLQGQTVGMDRFESRFALHACSHPMEAQMAFVDLLESGVLERHPNLKFVFLEAGCSWVASWLWRLDNICYDEFPSLTKENIKKKPSEYFKQHCWVGVEIGEPLTDTLNAIGHHKLLFGSDYPHPDHLHLNISDIPQLLPELSQQQIQDILEHNPKSLFNI
ncbi:hypothetical protein A7985_05225 [Pseudoalteromonas luteoviolacea]|uniref:Amidohydrolase-related domain-containing protein n=1 Tax=Pseudoalteromonas luteoviolacea TaxID=43657 RepID=A0A1C0TVJ6_9GAMM|nr:amidohydrolase family protein [Pseudoalteromonas luteoviolacea]OCQ23347.1 hypothetical protein A7985_05225 [Pseudoalteromonas luteoviolacea]